MRFKEIKDLLIKEGRWDERTGEYYPSPKEQADLDAREEAFKENTIPVKHAFEETLFEYLLHPVVKNSAQKIIQQYGLQDAMNKYKATREERLERDSGIPTEQDFQISFKLIDLIENNQPIDRQIIMTHLATMLAEINKYAIDIENFTEAVSVTTKPKWLKRAANWGYSVSLLPDEFKSNEDSRRKLDVYSVEWVNNEAEHDMPEQHLGTAYSLEDAKKIVQDHIRATFPEEYNYIFGK